MKLAILKVILWHNNFSHPPRMIDFKPGMINIITGESATGKSTLTAIIDYCLGSGKCSIPVGLIRDLTGWFGLHIQLKNTQLVVARRNPGEKQSTSDLFWIEGLNLEIPNEVEKNARVEDLKNRFNEISYLPHLDFSVDETVGFSSRPSFRDMAAFNFQPQHIVANPYTLFFKADTTEHREKLRVIFPLVLGVINANTLSKMRELKDITREHEKLRRELEARLNASRAWEAEIESYYLQARSLGLLPGSQSPESTWPLDKYILELQKIPANVKEMDIPDIEEGTSEAAVNELTQLVNEEDRLAQKIGVIRRRLSKLDQLSSSVGEYGSDLASKEDRMLSAGWFERKLNDSYKCPVCLADHTESNQHLAELHTLAQELKKLTISVTQAPIKLDVELTEMREELRELEKQISKARQKRNYLESQSNEISAQRQGIRQIYLFVGRVEQALENVSVSRNVEELRSKLRTLSDRIDELKQELDPRNQKKRLDAAIEKVSYRISDYARGLKLEHATENVKLNIRELSMQFTSLSGRKDFLWEVGSGQNWVGYHVAGLLALHEHFIDLGNSPVPRFLLIDQPSQVYFPEAWPTIDKYSDEDSDSDISQDIVGVHRIFDALSSFIDSVEQQFQVIVTEHAGAITWEGLKHIHVVGNWRDGHDEYLIPKSWLVNG